MPRSVSTARNGFALLLFTTVLIPFAFAGCVVEGLVFNAASRIHSADRRLTVRGTYLRTVHQERQVSAEGLRHRSAFGTSENSSHYAFQRYN